MCNDTKLFFALRGEDLIRDQIPLEEIVSVDIMQESKDLEDLLSTLGTDLPGRASIGAIGAASNKNRRPSNKNKRSSIISNYISFPSSLNLLKTEDSIGISPKAFQIHTEPEGFNSGRTYYLQARTGQECEIIVEQLKKYAAVARAKGETASRIRRAQGHARLVHDSRTFQTLSALVIITVTCARLTIAL